VAGFQVSISGRFWVSTEVCTRKVRVDPTSLAEED
jgi:hypothetical protein